MIVVESVGKKFDEHWILRGITFSVARGKSAALIGPSGSGKSVLLKMIAGLLTPDEGRIEVRNKNLGMLFQKNALFDSFTVLENLLFPLRERQGLTGAPAREKATRLLKAVGLAGTEDQYPDEISGGMQKRLGIARALVVDPEVILYDEPTAGLDPITSRIIAELIVRLRQETGSTILSVTNDIHRASQLGDEIYLLAQGSLHRAGTPKEAMQSRDPMIHQFVYGLRSGPLTSGLA